MPVIEQVVLIIVIGAIVAIAARRMRIPYTVGLVLAGIVLAVLPLEISLPFSKQFIFEVLLPPLIFEAALFIDWHELRRDLLVVGTYATVGVVLSAAVTAALMHFVIGWEWTGAVLFGILIAATDPVAVIATFKDAAVKGRIRLLVESESLFNDGTAAVAFALALTALSGASVGLGGAIWQLVFSAGGGVLCGIVMAAVALLIIGRTKDHLAELAMTTLAAFGSFWLAEHFQMSGILATTAAGLVIGNAGALGPITEKGAASIEDFWEFAAFAANSVIFIVLGINLANQNLVHAAWPIIVAVVAVLLGRAVAVYPCSAVFARTKLNVKLSHRHILFWGGLRGALALALALSLPDDFPLKADILIVTFGVVAFSVFVQSPTVAPLMHYFGELSQEPANELSD